MDTGRKLIIFTDIGDTIVNERTEIRDETGTVVFAECIPGSPETYRRLYNLGFTIAMVADGTVQSFHNTMTMNNVDYIFSAKAISEAVGAEKPDMSMFETALKKLNLTDSDKDRIIMVGNNLKCDIIGANRFGIRSVLLKWSTKRSYIPSCDDEVPDYIIDKPEQLIDLALKLDSELR